MKKALFIFMAAALAFASCKKDDTGTGQNGKTGFKITLDSPTAYVFGRAMDNSGGMGNVTGHSMRYILQVYTKGATPTLAHSDKKVVAISASSVSFDVELEPELYDFLFWADFVTDAGGTDLYYNTADLRNVQMLKTGSDYLGDHTRDAYFAAVLGADLETPGYTFPATSLKRPFGRIEVSSNDYNPADNDKKPTSAKLTYSGAIASAFNVATGDVVAAAPLSAQTFTRAIPAPTSGTTRDLVYDYIFAAKDKSTKAAFAVELSNAGGTISTRTMNTIPVHQNKRTILAGDFFTSNNAEFTGTVNIDDFFEGDPLDPDADYLVTDLAASDATEDGFTLTWNAVAPAISYYVECATNSSFSTGRKTFSGITEKTVAVTGLTASTTYYVRVTALSPLTGFSYTCASITQATAATASPDPTLTAAAATQERNIIAPKVTLTWNNVTSPVTLRLTPTSGATVTHTITASELTAKSAVITDATLQTAMSYTADILDASSSVLATTNLATAAIRSTITVLESTDDLQAAIVLDGRTDTIFLKPGAHAISATTDITKNLVLTSADPTATTVTMTKNFTCKATVDRLSFSNIKFASATYFLQNKDAAYNIGLIKWDNCIIDLQAASTSMIGASSTTAQSSMRIGELLFNNSIMYALGTNTYGTIYHQSGTGDARAEKITLKNSTISTGQRGVINTNNAADYKYVLDIENCTMYNIMTTGSTSIGVFIISSVNTSSEIKIKNTVLHAASSGLLFYLGSGSNATPDISDFYVIQGGAITYKNTPTAVSNAVTLLNTSVTPTDIFTAPNTNPTAVGADFKIKTNSAGVPTTCGDPRWL